jgi:hypothetical protein
MTPFLHSSTTLGVGEVSDIGGFGLCGPNPTLDSQFSEATRKTTGIHECLLHTLRQCHSMHVTWQWQIKNSNMCPFRDSKKNGTVFHSQPSRLSREWHVGWSSPVMPRVFTWFHPTKNWLHPCGLNLFCANDFPFFSRKRVPSHAGVLHLKSGISTE